MGIANFITALLLFSAGIFFCGWFLWSLLKPFFGSKLRLPSISFKLFDPGRGEEARFRKAQKALQLVAASIGEQNTEKAIGSIRSSVYFEVVRHTPELVARSAHHHTDLLEKMIILSELRSRSIKNLPVLESLFTKRSELLASVFEAQASRNRFAQKQKKKGKKAPAWSTKDFDVRLKNLFADLETNADAIRKQVDTALDVLNSDISAPNDTEHYH